MTVKVEIRDGESVTEALRRLRHAVRHAYRRQWYKTRPGSYDKPSYRRGRKETLRQRNIRNGGRWYTTIYVDLRGLLAPTSPFTPARKTYEAKSVTHDDELTDERR